MMMSQNEWKYIERNKTPEKQKGLWNQNATVIGSLWKSMETIDLALTFLYSLLFVCLFVCLFVLRRNWEYYAEMEMLLLPMDICKI